MATGPHGHTRSGAAAPERLNTTGAATSEQSRGRVFDATAVFHERMIRLASRTRSSGDRVRTDTWIVWSISGEQFAVQAASLRGISRIEHIARPFRMAPGMLGVICHMGRLLTVLDTRVMMGLHNGTAADIGDCILLPTEVYGEIALRVDDAAGTIDLTEAQICAARNAYAHAEAHVCGRTAAGVILIDLPILLTRTIRQMCVVDAQRVK